MNDYEKQAEDFLHKTNSTLLVRWLKYDYYFAGDKDKRDIWECKLSKGTREYIFTFGSSISDHEKMVEKIFRIKNANYCQGIIDEKLADFGDFRARAGLSDYKKTLIELSESKTAGITYRPTAYSILACLTTYDPEENIDDFADAYGYEKPSEAIKAYEAVKKEYENIRMLFSDDEIDLLSQIQ